MQVKDLSREMMFAEIIAERDNIILTQHQQIETLQKELSHTTKELEAMRAGIEKLKAVKEA